MANWFRSVFNVVCRKRLSSPRCRSELIDSAWVVIVPGQKCVPPPRPPPKKNLIFSDRKFIKKKVQNKKGTMQFHMKLKNNGTSKSELYLKNEPFSSHGPNKGNGIMA